MEFWLAITGFWLQTTGFDAGLRNLGQNSGICVGIHGILVGIKGFEVELRDLCWN